MLSHPRSIRWPDPYELIIDARLDTITELDRTCISLRQYTFADALTDDPEPLSEAEQPKAFSTWVFTDGHENASGNSHMNKSKLSLRRRRRDGLMFMGAGIDFIRWQKLRVL